MSLETPIALFNVGGTELVVILIIAMMLFGGEKLPELARGLGKAMRDFKKATAGVEEELKRAMAEEPPKRKAAPAAPVPPFTLPDSTRPPAPMEAQILPPPQESAVPTNEPPGHTDHPKPPGPPA